MASKPWEKWACQMFLGGFEAAASTSYEVRSQKCTKLQATYLVNNPWKFGQFLMASRCCGGLFPSGSGKQLCVKWWKSPNLHFDPLRSLTSTASWGHQKLIKISGIVGQICSLKYGAFLRHIFIWGWGCNLGPQENWSCKLCLCRAEVRGCNEGQKGHSQKFLNFLCKFIIY